jgi:hypothetical protein
MSTTRGSGTQVAGIRTIAAAAVLVLSALTLSPIASAAPEPAAIRSDPVPASAYQRSQAQPSCFRETGFCITNPAFQEYFSLRGGARILGFPVSRQFILDGFEVQIFQRAVLQLNSGAVERLNILDPGVMPITRANQSTFPAPDAGLSATAPQVGSASYARGVVEFVASVAPDTWNGQQVGFFNLFSTTVPVASRDAEATTLLNLEIWGLPTSRPTADPNNPRFVYQRFQRGIMHFRAECRCTEGILVGDYFKSVLTAQDLPADLAADMQRSRFYGQYSPAAPNGVARPRELSDTSMMDAFEPNMGSGSPPVPAPPAPPSVVHPVAPAAAPPGAPAPGAPAQGVVQSGAAPAGAARVNAALPGAALPTGAMPAGAAPAGATPAATTATPTPATPTPTTQTAASPTAAPPSPTVTLTATPQPTTATTPTATPTPGGASSAAASSPTPTGSGR